ETLSAGKIPAVCRGLKQALRCSSDEVRAGLVRAPATAAGFLAPSVGPASDTASQPVQPSQESRQPRQRKDFPSPQWLPGCPHPPLVARTPLAGKRRVRPVSWVRNCGGCQKD